jgi:hypothetical protein
MVKAKPAWPRTVPGGAALCHRIFTRLGCQGRPPRFVVEFYPYANLTLTARKREDSVLVRFSDLLRAAPRPVLEAAAGMLLARFYGRTAPVALTACYRTYARLPSTRRRILQVRRSRLRWRGRASRSKVFNLAAAFRRLNRRHFAGRLPQPNLGWSARPWRRQFGCYDPAVREIVINCRLDRAVVPRVALEYVLFHEMLHVKHPRRRAGCTLVSHSAKFRREEKGFPGYEEARRILRRLV